MRAAVRTKRARAPSRMAWMSVRGSPRWLTDGSPNSNTVEHLLLGCPRFPLRVLHRSMCAAGFAQLGLLGAVEPPVRTNTASAARVSSHRRGATASEKLSGTAMMETPPGFHRSATTLGITSPKTTITGVSPRMFIQGESGARISRPAVTDESVTLVSSLPISRVARVCRGRRPDA